MAVHLLPRDTCDYTACYCEENVYKLCEAFLRQGVAQPEELFACFISNPQKAVALWRQRASKRPDGLVLWDYHVILLQVPRTAQHGPLFSHMGHSLNSAHSAPGTAHSAQGPDAAAWTSLPALPVQDALVWDLDTQLPFPCSAADYVEHTLRHAGGAARHLNPLMDRYFRVVPARLYLDYFASDRRHMLQEVTDSDSDSDDAGDGSGHDATVCDDDAEAAPVKAVETVEAVTDGACGVKGTVEGVTGASTGVAHPGTGAGGSVHSSSTDGAPDSTAAVTAGVMGQGAVTVGVMGQGAATARMEGSSASGEGTASGRHTRWLSPPPVWPVLRGVSAGCVHNLDQYWEVGPHNVTPHLQQRHSVAGPAQAAHQTPAGAVGAGAPSGVGVGSVSRPDAGAAEHLGVVCDEDAFVQQVLGLASNQAVLVPALVG